MIHEHPYRIFDSVAVLIKLSTYLTKSIIIPTIDNKKTKMSHIIIWSLDSRRALANMARSFKTLTFCCFSYFTNISLPKRKDLFMALYLSFFDFRFCQRFTHNNNSLLRVLISSFITPSFNWDCSSLVSS